MIDVPLVPPPKLLGQSLDHLVESRTKLVCLSRRDHGVTSIDVYDALDGLRVLCFIENNLGRGYTRFIFGELVQYFFRALAQRVGQIRVT